MIKIIKLIVYRVQLLAVFCILTFNLFSQDSIKFQTYYYPSGVKSSEGYLVNGKPDKYWINYYENGVKSVEGNRKNYQLDSIWNFYNRSGKIINIISYSQGKKNGWSYFFSDSLNTKEFYQKGIKNGKTFEYYPNGNIHWERNFVKGKEQGNSYEYSYLNDSLIITIKEYKNDVPQKEREINRVDHKKNKQGMWIQFYDSKSIKKEEPYLNNLLHGYVKMYDTLGGLKEIKKYEYGVLIENPKELMKAEVRKETDSATKIKTVGPYVDGKKDGVFKSYDEKGSLIAVENFQNGISISYGNLGEGGVKNGAWKEYYEDKKLKIEGTYTKDIKTGVWKYYHRNGALEQTGQYNTSGKAIGEWKWYYDNGNLLREETFENGLEEGEMTEYSIDGKIISKGKYSGGMKEGMWLYEMGVYKEFGNYKDDLKEGMWKHEYTDNNTKRFEGEFIAGQAAGEHKYYYPSGNLKSKGPCVGGYKNGDWIYYLESGEQEKIITFINDEEYKVNGQLVVKKEKDGKEKKH